MPIWAPQERLGQELAGRYRVEAVLSRGGMGVLFRGFDRRSAEPVAIKMPKPAYALDPERLARFEREAHIGRRLQHPSVARTLDVGAADDGVPFVVMELLSGHTLAHELELRGALSLHESLRALLPIMQALAAAHALGIVHRDVKPSNIFLCSDSEQARSPKLLDFGIARSEDCTFETETGVLVGTPGYIAPEQARYAECTSATDIWGVGAVLYHCLTGRPPHAGDRVSEVLQRLISEPVPALRVPGVSKRACAIIDRALAREPHRRYASMDAFAHALGGYAHLPRDANDTPTLGTSTGRALRIQSAPRARVFWLVGSCAVLIFGAQEIHSTSRAVYREAVSPVAAPAPVHPPPAAAASQPAAVAVIPQEPPAEPPALPKPARPARAHSTRERSAAQPKAAAPFERERTTGLPVAVQW